VIPEFSRLQTEHLVESSHAKDLDQVRMDMLNVEPAPSSVQLLSKIDEFAQNRTGNVLNVAEVDDKSNAVVQSHRIDEYVPRFRI
jgi:hypothetical protein